MGQSEALHNDIHQQGIHQSYSLVTVTKNKQKIKHLNVIGNQELSLN